MPTKASRSLIKNDRITTLRVLSTAQSFNAQTGAVIVDGGIYVDKASLFNANMRVGGDLTVDGSISIASSNKIATPDTLIILNHGETGAGVTPGYDSSDSIPGGGVEVDRGSLPNYQFVFDETTDLFKIGEKDSTLQAVATREDAPIDQGIAVWQDSSSNFVTSSDFLFSGGNTLTIGNLITTSDLTVNGFAYLDTIRVSAGNDFTVTTDSDGSVNMGSNTISSNKAVALGSGNIVGGIGASVLGGEGNNAPSNYATVVGGRGNTASGLDSVAIGASCVANMNNSFALGNNVLTGFNNSFVWGDGSALTSAEATSNFTARTSGGARFITDSLASPLRGVKLLASDSKWVTLGGNHMDANAVEIRGTVIASSNGGAGLVPSDGQALVYSNAAGEWILDTVTTGSSGDATSLRGIDIATTAIVPSDRQILVYNGGTNEWEPNAIWSSDSTQIGDAVSLRTIPIAVNAIQPSDRQMLVYNASTGEWEPNAVYSSDAGELGDAVSIRTVPIAENVMVPSDGQVLIYNDATGEWIADTVTTDIQTNWANWTPVAGANIDSIDTIHRARYVEVGTVTTVTIDASITVFASDVTGTPTIIFTGLPSTPISGSDVINANGLFLENLTIPAVTPGRIMTSHLTDTLTVNAEHFSHAHQWRISGQITYETSG